MAIDLTNVAAGVGGFAIYGQEVLDYSGWSVASAGDLNGDGFDDLVIGAPYADGRENTRNHAGDSYVVFGHAGAFAAQIDLAAVAAGTGGFVIHGQDAGDNSGSSVSSAGDINGDGFDDLIIGARNASDSYVVFGHAGAFAAEIDLAAVAAGTGGFVIHGHDVDNRPEISVATAGDINGDGFDDLIIGAEGGDGPGNTRDKAGDSYVVFGQAGAFAAEIDLAAVAAGTGGFVIHGQDAGDYSGISVSSAGDINGDGFDDVIIGAFRGDGPGNTRETAGDSYVVFGHAGAFAAEIDLAAVAAGTGGFVIHGQDAGDYSGGSVASAGDINGDGFDDLIIGASRGDGPGNTRDTAGDSYVVFGHAGAFAAEIDLAAVAAGTGGFVIHGQDAADFSGSVASAGDINGDGFDDLIIGAAAGDGPGNTRTNAGDTYVVFGHAGTFAAEIDLAAVAAGIGGFVIYGQDAIDLSGKSVATAGDIDGDGFDDLIIGADHADGPGNTRVYSAGDSYVLFGSGTIGGSVDHVTHLGGAGNDGLTGNAAANVMVGGLGADALIGNGGADVMRGGEGNDTLVISDATFQRVEGGNGFDVLAFAGGITLTDAEFRRVGGIEMLRLGNGRTDLTLGTIAEHAIDGTATISIDGLAVTGASVAVSGSALTRGLVADLSTDATDVTLTGGSGNDVFVGGSGNDLLDGRGGADSLVGGGGIDTARYFSSAQGVNINLATGLGSGGDATGDTLSGIEDVWGSSSQGDFLIGDGVTNQLSGFGGDDLLDGGGGADIMFGGSGNDTYFVDKVGDQTNENPNDGTSDTVFSSVTFSLSANVENLILQGSADLRGYGNGTANAIYGNTGNNLLDGGGGADLMAGGAGNDVYFADDSSDSCFEAANQGNDTVFASANFGLAADVENLILQGSADLRGYGNSTANAIYGNSGNNLLDGGGDADLMVGGAGNDIYFADDSSDSCFEVANQGNDTVFASANFGLAADVENLILQGSADLRGYGNGTANAIYGNTGNNLLDGGGGADLMVGGAGNDIYFADDSSDSCFEVANQGNDTVFASASFGLAADVENLILQGSADLRGYGNGTTNAIYGNSGNNLLDGGGGADLMAGGAGNDVYFADDSSDSCFEAANQGNDTVFASASFGLAADVENLILQGSADLRGYGNGTANAIYGNTGNNLLDGGGGADLMAGGAGNDVYFADDSSDSCFEAANQGNDTVFASANFGLAADVENLILQGSGNLSGTGNALANNIYGNTGNNLLDGGGGADQLTGRAGNDIFVFNMGEGNGETIVDFAGNGASVGDALQFSGYGGGATFTNIDATHWQVNYNGGSSHDIITFMNGAAIDNTDYLFS